MLGFRPARLENHNDMRILKDNDGMEKVNEKLNVYKKWEELLDASIIVTVPDSKIVFEWRE